MLEESTRVQCFQDLLKMGTEKDIDPLKEIVKNESESEQIRISAQDAIDAIQSRLQE